MAQQRKSRSRTKKNNKREEKKDNEMNAVNHSEDKRKVISFSVVLHILKKKIMYSAESKKKNK